MFESITRFLAKHFGKKEEQDELPLNLSAELPESTFQQINGEIAFLFPKYEPCTVSSGRAEAFLRACRKIVVSHNIHPLTMKLKCIERGLALKATRTAQLARDPKETGA